MEKQTKIHCRYDELINPYDLKDHPKNRNKHPQSQIDRLIILFGFHGIRHPVIVSNLSGYVVAGHGRKLAAIKAGLPTFPVVFQDFETYEAEYAFLQADNAIGLWSDLDLQGINVDLPDLGPDFNLDVLGVEGFMIDPSSKSSKTSARRKKKIDVTWEGQLLGTLVDEDGIFTPVNICEQIGADGREVLRNLLSLNGRFSDT